MTENVTIANVIAQMAINGSHYPDHISISRSYLIQEMQTLCGPNAKIETAVDLAVCLGIIKQHGDVLILES